jgi:Iap family predicted aminopeptidase
MTEPAISLEQALEIIRDTADYYHSMLDHDTQYWWHNYWAALDLLERIQGLPEGSLMKDHDLVCDCATGSP